MEYWKIQYLENSLKKYIEAKNKQNDDSGKDPNQQNTNQMQSAMSRKISANVNSITKQMNKFTHK